MAERALITGAGGFVGRHLGAFLAAQGLEVLGLGRSEAPPSADWLVRWYGCDLTNAVQVSAAVRHAKPNHIFHLAALLRGTLKDLLAVNVVGTQNLMDSIVRACPEAGVLVAGSSAEYGLARPEELPIRETNALRPLGPYGVSKVAQTMLAAQYAHNQDLRVVVSRTFNLTGPGEPDSLVCSALARQIAEVERGNRPPVIQMGSMEAARDFLDVRDAVRAYWLLASLGQPGEAYNVCSGRATTVREVLDSLIDMALVKVEVRQDNGRRRAGDVPAQSGDYDRIHGITGWKPAIALRFSLEDCLANWRQSLSHCEPRST